VKHTRPFHHVINKNGGLGNEMGQTELMGIGGCTC